MKVHRRLEMLEQRLGREPIELKMADNRVERIGGSGDYVLDLLVRSLQGDRMPELELIAQSASSTEPGDGHLLDLARALLNGPTER